MKDVIIIITILIIVMGGALLIQNFLNNGTDKLVSKLEVLKEDIEQKNVTVSQDGLNKKTDEIYTQWEEINPKWSTVVLHDEIDLIDMALIRMKAKIKTENIKESMEDIDTSIFLLKHIKEKEKTSLKNIF